VPLSKIDIPLSLTNSVAIKKNDHSIDARFGKIK
jgi:hypothetical protein